MCYLPKTLDGKGDATNNFIVMVLFNNNFAGKNLASFKRSSYTVKLYEFSILEALFYYPLFNQSGHLKMHFYLQKVLSDLFLFSLS